MLRSAAISLLVLLAGCVTAPEPAPSPPPPAAPKVALALGGGAARGFAHVGVIKVLEAQGIVPDIIVGTGNGQDNPATVRVFRVADRAMIAEITPFGTLSGAGVAAGDIDGARKEFETMRAINPRAAAALVELAGIEMAEGNPEGAKDRAQAALAIDAAAPGARLFLAQALEAEGDVGGAWAKAQEEARLSPEDFRATYFLAQLAPRVERHAEIEPLLRRTIALEPRFTPAYLSLARFFLSQERNYEEGIALTNKALELGPRGRDEALARFLLADFYSRTGRHDLSRANAARGRALAAR